MFSASSPALPPESQESFKSRKHIKLCFKSDEDTKCKACDAVLVDLALVLYDHVLLMDGFQQGRGQRLEVRDGLWC